MFRHVTSARCLTAALILSASLFTHHAYSQDGRQSVASRPEPLGTVQTVDPELDKILMAWEQRSTQVAKVKGEFKRIVYDQVFQTAKCAVGRYAYESPDRGRMDFAPDPNVKPDSPPAERGGVKFAVQADESKWWICDGEQILDIDPVKKEYSRVTIPPRYRGRNISDGPLPFLFGMSAEKIKKRYSMKLGSMHDPEKIVHIVAYPLNPSEQQEYRVAEVLLDPVNFLPKAIQLADTSGNKQTVYIFTKHERPSLEFLQSNPYKPMLLGYTLLHDKEADAPLDRESKKNDGILVR